MSNGERAMIAGTGVDIIEVERVDRAIERLGKRFIEKVFTEAEAAYCGSRHRPALHYAARFAAKEAVLKALGTGWSRGIGWRDIETAGDSSRGPAVRLHGVAERVAREKSITAIHLSLSHTSTAAIAFAVAERK